MVDFAGILSDVSAFTNPFGPPSKDQWNLTKGIYTNSENLQVVLFFETTKGEDPTQKTAIDQSIDSGGRRVAIYEYPYVDGQITEDLGRKGETYTLNIKFFGSNYQSKYREFIDTVVNDPGPGTLLHPTLSGVRGSLPVRFKDYEIIHRYDEFNAVTIKATFTEDNTGEIFLKYNSPASQDSLLRKALQTLTNIQSLASNIISTVSALLNLPGSLSAALKQRLDSIVGQVSRLLGQLAATFSSRSKTTDLAAQSASLNGGVPAMTSGTVNTTDETGATVQAKLPPVFQVGFDPVTFASINNQLNEFINANQITPQQAVYTANEIRTQISAALAEVNDLLGNDGYQLVLQYRLLAITIQEAVEACIAATQTQVRLYTVPFPMSLRAVAINNGLQADRQNDIEALNPYLGSVNYVPRGIVVTVPAV